LKIITLLRKEMHYLNVIIMDLAEIQRTQERFIAERGWEKFPASQVFTHLVEEVGEIGRHILYEEGYKVRGLGHESECKDIGREFAQSFNLFLQLAQHFRIDLEKEWAAELALMEKRFPKEKWKEHMGKRV
jgi:NTP pyrophosphatase (non-canonical NTP hydrolase)